MKKRVAIIYSGQIRTNSLNPNPRDNQVLESLQKYLLNDEFKAKYDHDVFISTDDINIEKAYQFFGPALKNIAFWEKGTFLNPISRHVTPHEPLYTRFRNKDFGWLNPYAEQYHQYYRAYLACEMVRDYQAKTEVKYDYFIKLRPDIRLKKNLLPIFEQLDGGKKAFMEHNLLEIMSFEFFDLLWYLANFYGEYTQWVGDGHNINGEYPNFCPMDCISIRYASEMQVTNCLYGLMRRKNYDPSEHFFGSDYNKTEHSYCTLHR